MGKETHQYMQISRPSWD